MSAWSTSSGASEGDLIAGRYRVEQVIGRGGMGQVVAARDESTGQEVAIKLLRAEGTVHLERFLREARLISSLESEHIVRIVEVGAADDRHPFLVMERLRGADLGARLRNGGPLPLVEVVNAAVQACEALTHAHQASIVHRDIKPSNLFCHESDDGDVIVKVLDFGVSKRTGGDESTLTLTTENAGALGSPPYMSPEQVRDPRKVDGRTDLWSLGVVMYRLLSGTHPFDGATTSEILAAIRERPYVPLREIGTMVPAEVDAIIARCLARPLDERYATAADVARALAPFAAPRWAALAARLDAIGVRAPPRRPFKDDPDTITVAPPPPAPTLATSAFGPLERVEHARPPAAPVDVEPRAARRYAPLVLALVLVCVVVPGTLFALRLSSRPAVAGSTATSPDDAEERSASPRAPTSAPAIAATTPDDTAEVSSAISPAVTPLASASGEASAAPPGSRASAPRHGTAAPRKPPPHPHAKASPSGRPELYPSPYRE